MNLDKQSTDSFHCPRWAQLPALPLYMDQVIMLLQAAVEPFSDEKERVLTASMVNNYVKQGLIPAPEKKRYTSDHVARLVMVTVLKRVLPMAEISQTIQVLVDAYGMEEGYDLFCQRLEDMLALAFGANSQVIGPVEMEGTAQDPLNAALAALMGRFLVQARLRALAGEEPPT